MEIKSDRPVSQVLLLHGIRNLLRCDSAEVVSGIARFVMSQHRSLRVGSALMDRMRGTPLPSMVATLGAGMRFLEVRQPQRAHGVISVARLSNERRALQEVAAATEGIGWTELSLRRRPDRSGISHFFRTCQLRRMARIARLLHRRYEFFRVLRAAELIGYYSRYLRILRDSQFSLALLSSHSNPHGIAFNVAARKAGIPVVLVTHGMPVRPVARLHFDLALVHCEAARQTYVDEGCQCKQVMIHGRRERHDLFPDTVPDPLKVAVFLCKDVNEVRLKALCRHLLANQRISRVLIRPHPKNLWRSLAEWIKSEDTSRLQLSENNSVIGDLQSVDLVLAGNSSVLVDAATAGKPVAFVPGLDYAPVDMHDLVSSGLIFSTAEINGQAEFSLEPDKILSFYQRPGYQDTLRRFANIDEDETVVLKRFAGALRGLVPTKLRSS